MQAHRQVAALLVQEALQRRQHPDRAQGDAFWAPGETPRSSEYFDDAGHGGVVVERLAHPHEYGVGELCRFVGADELVEDVCGVELPVETLPAGHAELAGHFAPRLGANTQRFPLLVGNHHGLDER